MPNHINEIQHQQYVLKGEAKVMVGDEEYHAKAGDFIYIPAGVVQNMKHVMVVAMNFMYDNH